MISIDVIILSYAKNDSLKQTTLNCLESLVKSESQNHIQFNIIILESNKSLQPFRYPNCQTYYPKESFGYHKYLNLGIQLTKNTYICFCNNDLIFHHNWATEILKVFENNKEILSCSPQDPWLHKQFNINLNQQYIIGYEKMEHFTGWCFMVKRNIFNIIGLFDEKLTFWYCDDDFLNNIKRHQIKHALVTASHVDHKSGQTITSNSITVKKREDYTSKQWLYFDYKWNHNSIIVYKFKSMKYYIFRLLKKLKYGILK